MIRFIIAAVIATLVSPAMAKGTPEREQDVLTPRLYEIAAPIKPPVAPPTITLDQQVLTQVIADLTYAAALAHATGNKITAPCWDAQLRFIGAWANALKAPDGTDMPMPTPHIITDAERISEIINSIQPDSDVSLACAAMAQATGKAIATIVGAVLTGGAATLFKLPIPVIP